MYGCCFRLSLENRVLRGSAGFYWVLPGSRFELSNVAPRTRWNPAEPGRPCRTQVFMYNHILVAIENSDADRAVLEHVEQLARMTGARLLLVHVADGWAARAYNELNLRESEEIHDDREYLARLCDEMTQ